MQTNFLGLGNDFQSTVCSGVSFWDHVETSVTSTVMQKILIVATVQNSVCTERNSSLLLLTLEAMREEFCRNRPPSQIFIWNLSNRLLIYGQLISFRGTSLKWLNHLDTSTTGGIINIHSFQQVKLLFEFRLIYCKILYLLIVPLPSNGTRNKQ